MTICYTRNGVTLQGYRVKETVFASRNSQCQEDLAITVRGNGCCDIGNRHRNGGILQKVYLISKTLCGNKIVEVIEFGRLA